jgi:hypothetical protein
MRLLLFLILVLSGSLLAQPTEQTCLRNLQTLTAALEDFRESHSDRYPTELKELIPGQLQALPVCPEAASSTYRYVVSLDLLAFGMCCAGSRHTQRNFPAASSSSGVVNKPNGVNFAKCRENLKTLAGLCEGYRKKQGTYPACLAYVADRPGIHLPSCTTTVAKPYNETDYTIVVVGDDDYHLFCTSVNHLAEGFAPLQPSLINGLPAKAMFFWIDGRTP